MVFVQEESLPIEIGLEVVEPQDDCQQPLVGEGAAVVGNDMLTLLPILGQHHAKTHVVGTIVATRVWSIMALELGSGVRCGLAPYIMGSFYGLFLVCCRGQHGGMKVTSHWHRWVPSCIIYVYQHVHRFFYASGLPLVSPSQYSHKPLRTWGECTSKSVSV